MKTSPSVSASSRAVCVRTHSGSATISRTPIPSCQPTTCPPPHSRTGPRRARWTGSSGPWSCAVPLASRRTGRALYPHCCPVVGQPVFVLVGCGAMVVGQVDQPLAVRRRSAWEWPPRTARTPRRTAPSPKPRRGRSPSMRRLGRADRRWRSGTPSFPVTVRFAAAPSGTRRPNAVGGPASARCRSARWAVD